MLTFTSRNAPASHLILQNALRVPVAVTLELQPTFLGGEIGLRCATSLRVNLRDDTSRPAYVVVQVGPAKSEHDSLWLDLPHGIHGFGVSVCSVTPIPIP
ncbi:MAG: hypothetical protein H6711_03775 [Myxococcales bacterium]|nr:hypothetical protein [Myxococcales bacterium]